MSINFPVEQEIIANQILPRLSNIPRGFNATYNLLAPDYGLLPDMGIDFAGALGGASANFVLGNVSPDDWIASGAWKFPLMTLFSDELANENYQKYHLFSGDVVIGLNVFVSWPQEKLQLAVFEPKMWCVSQALITLFNRASNAHTEDQDWGSKAVYNGGITLKKTRLQRGEQFWAQAILGQLKFQLDQRGEL